MKSIIVVLSCVAVLSGCVNDHKAPSNRLSTNISIFDPKDLKGVLELQTVSKEEVIATIDVLQKSMKNSYIGYDFKKKLAGKSGDEAFAECRAKADAGPEKLKSSDVYDYILQCLAGLNDTHLYLNRLNQPVFVTTAVSEARFVEGKLIVTRIRPGLIKKFEEILKLAPDSLKNKIKLGSEITSINGSPVQNHIAELKTYVSASSESFRHFSAVDEIFTRNFNYPKENEISLSLKLPDGTVETIVLPWVQFNGLGGSVESRSLLSDKGFQQSDLLSDDKALMDEEDLSIKKPLFTDLSAKRTYVTLKGSTALVTGLAKINDQPHCYMQLNTFSIGNEEKEYPYKVMEKTGDSKIPASLTASIKNFLSSCEAFRAPLIFDLRNNGGGRLRLGQIIYRYFELNEGPKLYDTEAFLMKSGNYTNLGGMYGDLDQPKTPLEQILTLNSVKSALEKKQTVTDWTLYRITDFEKNIFTGSVSVLTSENCISACDHMLNRFKLTGRGRIFGTHTNGTGYGFYSMGSGTTVFHDHLKLYSIDMPNFAFQATVVSDDKDFNEEDNLKGKVADLSSVEIMENRPTQPDHVIEYTTKDLTDSYADYIAALSKALAEPGK